MEMTVKNKNKEAFLIYKSNKEFKDLLNKEQKADLLDAIFEYQDSGKEIEMDLPTKLVFMHFKSQFEINDKKYGETLNMKSLAGKIGMAKRWGKLDKFYLDNSELLKTCGYMDFEAFNNDVENNNIMNTIRYYSDLINADRDTITPHRDTIDGRTAPIGNDVITSITDNVNDNVNDNVKDNVNDNDNKRECEYAREKIKTRSHTPNDDNNYFYTFQDLEAYYETMLYFFPNFNEKYAVNKNRGWSLEKWKRQMQAWEIDFQKDNRIALVSQNRRQTKSEQNKKTIINAFPEVFENMKTGTKGGREEKEIKNINALDGIALDDFINNG
jgi:hypothetical protein